MHSLTFPEFCTRSLLQLPEALVGTVGRDIEQIVGSQSRKEPIAGGNRNGERIRRLSGRIGYCQAPQRALRNCQRRNQAVTIGRGSQGSVSLDSICEPVWDSARDVDTVEPRTEAIGVIGKVQQSASLKQNRIENIARLRGDSIRASSRRWNAPNIPFIRRNTHHEVDVFSILA